MKCDRTIQNMLDGRSDSETLEHLKECPGCASFGHFSEFINENCRRNGDFSPPEKIGLAIKSAALKSLRNRNSMEKPGKIKFLYYISALAAGFAIVMGILLFIHGGNTGGTTKIVAETGKETRTAIPGPRSLLKWDDIDLTDEIEGVTEDIEISMSLIYSTDSTEEPADSEDMFNIEINELST